MIHTTTILDLARELGISKSTVSRALAGSQNVKAETRKAVMAMAEKMHYRPNHMARNLTKHRTRTIGVVVPEFINSFFSRIIIHIQKIFESEGFRVLITQCNESWEAERRNLQLLEENMVEGILISIAEIGKNTDYYDKLISSGIPLVFFNRTDRTVDASKVTIDDYKWALFATEHLILVRKKLGQKQPRIMHLRGPEGIGPSDRRYIGYVDALAKYRIPFDESLVIKTRDITKGEGFRLMSAQIVQGNIPDGIFCFNDPLAIGAMQALQYHGIDIPGQVSVMGFSESQSALITTPALSSVAQPLELMGETAARLLLDKINNPDSGPQQVVLNAKLNIRGSSDPEYQDYFFFG